MKVAYVFSSTTSQKILNTMIIPQLEKGTHGVEVAGMFFFMDNTFSCWKAPRWVKDCASSRKLTACCSWPATSAPWSAASTKPIKGAQIGCFRISTLRWAEPEWIRL